MEDNKELRALISLMDEPDELLFNQVCNRIYTYGFEAIPVLEEAWENSLDDRIQQRIIAIIHDIQQHQIFNELSDWAKFGYNDLLRGFLIVTRYQYPDLNIHEITRVVGSIIQEVWMELNPNLTPLEKIRVINHVIYDINKFSGNTANIQSPENFYLKQLLDTKKGNPLSLGMLYILVARSLKIPIYGVDLPKHFVLVFMDEIIENETKEISEEHVLFYLNPFNKGAVFTRNEIELYVRQLKVQHKASYFLPCSNLTIIRRMIKGLIETYQLSSNLEKVNGLEDLSRALDV